MTSEPFSKKEIKTNEFVDGISQDEWYLSKDANFVIREEWKKNKGKTGNLIFFDVVKNKKKKLTIVRKSPYGGGIIGFSLSGEFLFYNSLDKLYVVNIQNQTIIKEIQLPFSPIGIVWP